jgi:putative DNA primase/helicase
MKNPNIAKKANAEALDIDSQTLAHNGKSATPKVVNLNTPNASDAQTMLYGNQDEVAMLIGKQVFYDKWLHIVKGSAWYNWTGTYWQRDLKAGSFDTTRKGLRKAISEMKRWVQLSLKNTKLSKEDKEKLISAAEKADKTKREKRYIADIYALVSKDDKCTANPSQFDQDIHLLGTPGGTVDLKILKFIKTDPRRYISKQTACAPAEGEPVLWLQFLHEIFEGDQEVIDFIQILCGYALTGETGEEKLFFLYGCGANGKSKFLEILAYILCDYATRIAPKTLLNKGHPEHVTEIAKLSGARLVFGSELPAGETWDDQKLKELTGGDTVTARFMRQDYFDFKPQFTLLLAGNHTPQMKHVGEAERRRLVLIPFNVTIPVERRDPKLGEKLREEAGQILTWCIKGAGMYYKSGLKVPQSVLEASQDYLDSEDVVGEFLNNQLTPINGKEVELNQLVQTANDWFDNNSHNKAVDPKSLKKELKDRGKVTRRSGNKYYLQNHELVPS